MKMRITILGSGNMAIARGRFPAAFLVDIGEHLLLLDCGFGTLARLVEHAINPSDIDVVAVSHFHTDHFGDAFPLIHTRLVASFLSGQSPQPLLCIGPETLEDRFAQWRAIFWPEPKESYPVTFLEGSAISHRIGEAQLETFPVHHVPWFSSVGFRLTLGDRTIVYPGDIGSDHPFEDLVGRVRGADLLMIEAGAERISPNHFTPAQVVSLVEAAQPKRTIIVHNSPFPKDERRVARAFKGHPSIRIGEDDMVLDV